MTPLVPTLVTSHVPTAGGTSAPQSTTSALPSVSPGFSPVELSSPSSLLLSETVRAPELELEVSSPVVEPELDPSLDESGPLVVVGPPVLVSGSVPPLELASSTEPDESGVVASSVVIVSSSGSPDSSSPVDDEPPSPEVESSPHAARLTDNNTKGRQARDMAAGA
jgi:hypothetical protein